MIIRFNEGDTLIMKKKHPCGSNEMIVIHAGSDIKMRCVGCLHDVIVSREKIEKNIVKIKNRK